MRRRDGVTTGRRLAAAGPYFCINARKAIGKNWVVPAEVVGLCTARTAACIVRGAATKAIDCRLLASIFCRSRFFHRVMLHRASATCLLASSNLIADKRPIQHRYSLVEQREWCFATSPAYPRRLSCETAISGPSEGEPQASEEPLFHRNYPVPTCPYPLFSNNMT